MIYFTSDLHLDHANIIKYCARPFGSIGEMNAALIENWNARVGLGDVVYVIGDFALSSRERIAELRSKLGGTIVLVRGNHDRSEKALRECGFDDVCNELRLRLADQLLYLCHIPQYRNFGYAPFTPGEVHLCGHVHTDWKRLGNIINVGVDQWGFRPVTLAELLAAEETDMTGRTPRRPVP